MDRLGSLALRPDKRIVWRYYGFQFFFSLLLWLPVFYEYQRRIGLTDTEIFSIQSIYYLAFCLMELPTGFLADRLGRLACMRAGAAVLVVSNLVPIFFASYAGFLTHFLLVALSRSLISGAASAYLYDTFHAHGWTAHYQEIEGKARSYGLIGKVVFWSGIGLLMRWHLSLPYWMTAASALVSVGFAWALPESRETKPAAKPLGVASTGPSRGFSFDLMEVLKVVTQSPLLAFVMLLGISDFVLGRIVQVNLFQPVLHEKGVPVTTYGVVMSLMTLFEALGAGWPVLRRALGEEPVSLKSVLILNGAFAAGLWMIPTAGPISTVACLCFYALASGMFFPIQRQLLNDAIPGPRYRATLLSVESIVDRAVCAWVATLLGGFVAAGQTGIFLRYAAEVTFLGVCLVYFVIRMVGVGRAIALDS